MKFFRDDLSVRCYRECFSLIVKGVGSGPGSSDLPRGEGITVSSWASYKQKHDGTLEGVQDCKVV